MHKTFQRPKTINALESITRNTAHANQWHRFEAPTERAKIEHVTCWTDMNEADQPMMFTVPSVLQMAFSHKAYWPDNNLSATIIQERFLEEKESILSLVWLEKKLRASEEKLRENAEKLTHIEAAISKLKLYEFSVGKIIDLSSEIDNDAIAAQAFKFLGILKKVLGNDDCAKTLDLFALYDNNILHFEWIFHEKRLGISFEEDNQESTWFVIHKDLKSNAPKSGFVKDVNLEQVVGEFVRL